MTELRLERIGQAAAEERRHDPCVVRDLVAEVRRLRAVIQEVVDDDESREDGTGWGPDVTQLLKLKAALREP